MAQVFQSNVFQNNVFQVGAGGPASYTLDTVVGIYTLSGQSATLLKDSLLSNSVGAYTLTGQSTTLLKDNLLTVTPGAYTLTGASAELTYTSVGAYSLDTQVGDYTLTGYQATLEYTAGQTGGYSTNTLRLVEAIRRDDEEVMRLVIQAFNKIAA